MSALDPFYPIVDSAAWVGRLVGAGARFIQLRIKDATEDHLRSETHHAMTICRRSGAELVINDHWEIAIDSGAEWLHLGQGDLDEADVLAVRKAGIRLGISTHDDAELVRALTFAPDYIALGPIYPTRLKAMAFAPQGLERIGEWKRRIGAIPLVAIGGLTVERAKLCLAAGADIVSVVTDITLNADPERVRASGWRRRARRESKASDRFDHRRLGFGRRRGDSSRSQDLLLARRLRRERDHCAHRSEYARRAGDPLCALCNRGGSNCGGVRGLCRRGDQDRHAGRRGGCRRRGGEASAGRGASFASGDGGPQRPERASLSTIPS